VRRRPFAHLVLVVLAAFVAAAVAADAVCPRCGAPLEPGAQFCTRCGLKIAGGAAPPAAAPADTRRSVVQVVAAHDKELTSTYGSIEYGAKVKVDSLLGSAFAIAPGEFVTDAGLLIGAKSVALRTADGRTVAARIVGIDPMIGVGLLASDLKDVPAVTQRPDGLPRLGETVTAVGFPSTRRAGQSLTTSSGVVSGLRRGEWHVHPIEDYIQADASLPDGFAGAPVVDADGRVVGMSTAYLYYSILLLGPGAGIGISIPDGWINRSLDWIRAGTPPRAWIGAYTVAADSESRALYGLPENTRRVVEIVFPDTPAAAAGLRSGDGLLKLQGEEIDSLAGLHDRLLKLKPGDPVDLVVARKSETIPIHVTATARPDRARPAGLDTLRFYGGVDLVPDRKEGLVVRRVVPGSLGAQVKVSIGDSLEKVLSKKDLEHVERANARWRSVDDVKDLERFLATAYSDYDFYVGLRFRSRNGVRHELFLWNLLGPSSAL